MTQIERTINLLNTIEKNTVLTKQDYREITRKARKQLGEGSCSSWDIVIANPERFGVARIEVYTKTPTSKIKAIDVLEMIKEGKTVEEIEPMLYTQVKSVEIKIL